jgi:hypothetical protein
MIDHLTLQLPRKERSEIGMEIRVDLKVILSSTTELIIEGAESPVWAVSLDGFFPRSLRISGVMLSALSDFALVLYASLRTQTGPREIWPSETPSAARMSHCAVLFVALK